MPTEFSGTEGDGAFVFTVVAFQENLTTQVVVEFYTESGTAEGNT